ncbi:MAG: 2-oxo acid dehydrogenase subunit E2, partial [Pseudomonadota bacterium]
QIKGSGPRGRIVKADVENAVAQPATAAPAAAAAPAPAAAPASAPVSAGAEAVAAMAGGAPYELLAHTPMRKAIARRLTESKRDAPHFYLTADCRLDKLLETRKELNGRSDKYKLSVNDFVIRASALALKTVPEANAAWSDDGALMFTRQDVSVAVAIPGGLITPIIRDAGSKGLKTISAEMKDLAGRAREGKLKPEEFQGGTFSVSNLGMFGVKDFCAVINPPQGAILAVGAGEQRPVVVDGALTIATVMSVTLSVDHRVVDGAVGAQYLAAFKALIEDPLDMLL